jgi:hypothetical protein
MKDANPVSLEDRKLIDVLAAAIADPNTPEDKRAEYREELGGIANGYAGFECLSDEDKREYLASRKSN